MKLNLSPAALQKIRAKAGMAPLTQQQVQNQMQKAAASGMLSTEPTLASPGSIAYAKQKAENPEWVAQKEQARDEARAATIAKAPERAKAPRPPGVSQYVWDRVQAGTLDGLNTTSIINNPEVEQALIDAGHEDYVKAAYEKAMDQRAAHYGQNGASAEDAWANAQYDKYTEKYGEYKNDTVEATESVLGLGNAVQSPTNPGYVPPVVPKPKPSGPDGMFNTIGNTVDSVRNPEPPPATPEPPVTQPPPVTPPPPSVQCGPGQITIRGVCVDWDGPGGAGGNGGGNGGGQGNPNRRGPSTTGTGYRGAGAGPANTGIGQAGQNQATPWADAYFRAKERANAQGPVSRLFAKELEGN